MMMKRTVLLTGAAGNIGAKLAAHLRREGKYNLRLLDRRAEGDVLGADFAEYDDAWVRHFDGVDVVLHLAGDPNGNANWASVLRDNVGATQHVLRAAKEAGVRRVVFASTNQVMLGYRFKTGPVTVDLPPAPLSPYGISKLMCEQVGRAFHEETGADFLAWRIGYFQRGENLPGPHMAIGAWGQSMWLSNRDMLQAAEKSIEAPPFGYAVVYLMSNNLGMRWDIDHTREVIGYVPLDTAHPQMEAQNREQDDTAGKLLVTPGTWLDENFAAVTP